MRPVISFLERDAQKAVPNAVQALSGGGRYLNLNTSPIFPNELKRKGIPPTGYAEYFRRREPMNANLGMRYGLSSVGLYAGLRLKWTQQALSQPTLKGLSEMNCEFLVSKEPIQGDGLKEVWSNSFNHIYRNETVEPRAKLAASLISNGDESFVSIGTIQGSARILENTGQRKLSVEIGAEESGYLILADSFYPGWRVWINGIEAKIHRVNGWMRAVSVPAGRSKVNFDYSPRSFLWGSIFAIIGVLVTLSIVVRFGLKKRAPCPPKNIGSL